jgi:hypothetical protein
VTATLPGADVTDRNWRLTSAMDETGMSSKGLALRVEQMSARAGRPVRCGHTDIRRWRDGMIPRDPYKADLVAQVVSAKLGRHVTAEQLGLLPSAGLTTAPKRATGCPQGWRVARTRGHLALLVSAGPGGLGEVA